jgi:hypothetical protein
MKFSFFLVGVQLLSASPVLAQAQGSPSLGAPGSSATNARLLNLSLLSQNVQSAADCAVG